MADLKTLIDKYGDENAECNRLKKIVKEDNEEIKKIMLESGDENSEGNNYKVTCKTIVTEDFNEDKLLTKLKELWSNMGSMTNPYIKMVEVPNMEEIEKAIYSGELDPKKLAGCKESKSQVRLTVSKLKASDKK